MELKLVNLLTVVIILTLALIIYAQVKATARLRAELLARQLDRDAQAAKLLETEEKKYDLLRKNMAGSLVAISELVNENKLIQSGRITDYHQHLHQAYTHLNMGMPVKEPKQYASV